MKILNRRRFLYKNLLKGLAWFAAIVVIFLLVEENVPFYPESWVSDAYGWVSRIYDQPILVYLVFTISEILVGIIPPEVFFMLWSLESDSLIIYSFHIILLSVISYSAGIGGYWLGWIFSNSKSYQYLRRMYLRRYEVFFRRFGGLLIIVAALTPLPFSGICMMVGSVKFNFKKFLLYSAFRFLRFFIYASLVYIGFLTLNIN